MNISSYLFKSIIDTGASPSQKAVPQAQKLEEKQHCGYINLFFKLHKIYIKVPGMKTVLLI